jgi:predicted nuclease of restriction endonuclease-like RecB superfamily
VTQVQELRFLDHQDASWIGHILDVVEQCVEQPWRILLERVEHAEIDAPPVRVAAMLRALRRVLGGRNERGRIARQLRAGVLGHPALDDAAREQRLAAAAEPLGLAAADVDAMLWADLAMERPVTLPHGRPDAAELAAFANLDRIQRALRRAYGVQLRVRADANELVRTALRFGLIAAARRDASDAIVLEITGPLALFGSTTVYGRALTALAPLLADHASFTLDITCDRDGEETLRIASPVLLPRAAAPRRSSGPGLAERLARDLDRLGVRVEREPEPIAHRDALLFPELAVEHAGARWAIEIMGFSTEELVTAKLARYREAGVERVVLCVDEQRCRVPATALPCGRVVPFLKRIKAAPLLAALEDAP